ncbi:MAG TPA: restriction endonuclease [Nitrososphaera sp.]|nr:restriction endonuclease [Nitrososphaera sp.]
MHSTSTKKGAALEAAVRRIIETCLESDPKTKGLEFTVETNVRDMSSGVLHEIDLLVKTRPDSEHEATFLYECKNWNKPVGKNEVMVLAKKVDALRANRGFLVAKSLSKQAEKQLELEKRLRFLRCAEDFLSPFNTAEVIHISQEVLPTTVVVNWRDAALKNPAKLDPEKSRCRFNNEPEALLSTFIRSRIDEIAASVRSEHHARFQNEGTHWGQTVKEISFSRNQFLVDGIEVESITVPFFCFVTCERRKIISNFELEGQGQVFAFEPITGDNAEKPLEIHVVTRFRR